MTIETRLAAIRARAKDPATVSDLVAVCNDARKAHAALTAVLDIHVERERRRLDGAHSGGMFCIHCRRSWPCPTIHAITTALEVQG